MKTRLKHTSRVKPGGASRKIKPGVVRLPTEEQRVVALLKEAGAAPMPAEMKRRLKAVGQWGMPNE